jgi:hypothetical protein
MTFASILEDANNLVLHIYFDPTEKDFKANFSHFTIFSIFIMIQHIIFFGDEYGTK